MRYFILCGVLTLAGCSGVAQNPQKILSIPSEMRGAQAYMVSDAGKYITQSSEYDVIGRAIMSVGMGVALGSAAAGMSAGSAVTSAQQAESADKAAPFMAARAVSIAKIFEDELLASGVGSVASLNASDPNRLVATPRVNLRMQQGVDFSYQCNLTMEKYINGKLSWSRDYHNMGERFVKDGVKNFPSVKELELNSRECLNTLLSALKMHNSGDLSRAYANGLFKPGMIMYTSRRGQRSDYYKDGRTGLIYSIRPYGFDVVSADRIYSYTSN